MPARSTQLELPEFGLPTVEPQISAATYRTRLDNLKRQARAQQLDFMLVYADREHFANLSYLTGYDPRFEEALLVVNLHEPARKPWLLVGNEGFGFANISPVKDDLEIVLYQSFSLLGQDRSRSPRLATILTTIGIQTGHQLGLAGWKHFSQHETDTPDTWLDAPAFVVDTLRDLVGDRNAVRNANRLLMDSTVGMRATSELDQLARSEFTATYASQAVRNVLFGIKPGMTEFEAVQLMQLNGLPLSCHLMLSTGERAFLGMGSPSARVLQHGDQFTCAVGLWGTLTARAGFVVAAPHELPEPIRDYEAKLVAPYFQAIAAWYAHVGIGVPGGELYRIIHDQIGDPFFGVQLNPGHLIQLEEWVNSPIYADSTEQLRSGMLLQVDVIPATGTPYFTTNIEDTIALADADLRSAFAATYPEAWQRIQARRAFMEQNLGIRLKPEVLPFSNLPAYLPPYILSPQQAMVL
jgi:hypothetical protein